MSPRNTTLAQILRITGCTDKQSRAYYDCWWAAKVVMCQTWLPEAPTQMRVTYHIGEEDPDYYQWEDPEDYDDRRGPVFVDHTVWSIRARRKGRRPPR